MMFHVNDVVRVVRVPHSATERMGHLLGQIGVVEELNANGERVLFQGLKLPGLPTKAMAWIAVACLEPVNDPAWAGAVVEYRRWFAEVVREHEERKLRWRRELHDVAEKHKLTVQEVREIVSALEFNGAVYE